jgi:DnaJ-class molecular chaperone
MAGNNARVQTPYEILGVSPDAPTKAIEYAMKMLRLKYHPDKNTNESEAEQLKAEQMFIRVGIAYDAIMSERNKQKLFDFNGDDAMAIFSNEFGSGANAHVSEQGRGSRSSQYRPNDSEIDILLTRDELKRGITRVMYGERMIRLRSGGGVFIEPYEIEIVIPPGLHYGDRIRFVNYGEQTEFHSADVVYVIKEYIV